jgi:hypothetical protein
MKRIVVLALPLLAVCTISAPAAFAGTNTDGAACHHGLDTDKAKVAAISDSTKKAQAYGHLKTAYEDLKANNFTDCLTELKAAEALTQ